MKNPKILSTAFLLLVVLSARLGSQSFPELTSLDSRDVLFQQISNDVQSFYRWQSGNAQRPPLSLYQYTVKQNDNLFSLSARLNLPQSSIATINRLDSPNLPEPGTRIFIPNLPGIFLPEVATSDFERLLSQRVSLDSTIEPIEEFIIPSSGEQSGAEQSSGEQSGKEQWRFIIAEDFTGIERRAFLHILFRDPLPNAYISSSYGLRESPFSGKIQFHYGIDLASSRGTVVQSIAEGKVTDIGSDYVYGDYIRIEHQGGYESLYAHLGNIYVELGESVRSGAGIAEVGLSGLVTGAHLHFEIFYLGSNRNPQLYIRKNK